MTIDDTLRPEGAIEHLERAGLVSGQSAPTVESLGGGVSNVVLKASWDADCAVVKRPRSNLAVDDDWPADVGRVHNEAAAARAYRDVLDRAGLSSVRVPAVRYEDRTEHVVAMDCVPETARTWKEELLDGRIDTRVAEELGDALGRVHRIAADEAALAERFANDRPFEQLRLDPYHRTVAERHPELRDVVEREVERIAGVDRTLVHGDFSPKNVLVDRSDPDGGPALWLIDFEVAHWGDPAFDAAFLLNHLFIKSVYRADRQAAYLTAARRFWSTYAARVGWDVEAATVAELGVLLLARVDGKSPVEYVTSEATADALRCAARRTLTSDVSEIEAVAAIVAEETPP
jgi:5-methylthioribose kinase